MKEIILPVMIEGNNNTTTRDNLCNILLIEVDLNKSSTKINID